MKAKCTIYLYRNTSRKTETYYHKLAALAAREIDFRLNKQTPAAISICRPVFCYISESITVF